MNELWFYGTTPVNPFLIISELEEILVIFISRTNKIDYAA